MNGDKTDKSYWDRTWERSPLPKAVNPRARTLNNYVNRKFHEFFKEAFSHGETKGKKLLEIGCARSIWLPYFIREFGFEVYGIDYSEIGCHQAVQVLSGEGLEGNVLCADFFSPPKAWTGIFDVVVSFGVVEHFQDTRGCIARISTFLKPGGKLITMIPNLAGLMGSIQRVFNRDVFDLHVPLSEKDLDEAHRGNGLQVISCNYFLFANLGIMKLENLRKNSLWAWILLLLSGANRAIWLCEKWIPFLEPNRLSSPYISCVAIKPHD